MMQTLLINQATICDFNLQICTYVTNFVLIIV